MTVIDPRRLPPTSAVRFVATVSDLASVQRVLMMVVGRRHALTHFEATETPDARWRVTLDCPMDDRDPALLLERLRRAPCVLTVRSVPGQAGPPPAGTDPGED